MTLDRLGRWRLPAIAVVAIFLALAVVAGILLIGKAGTAFEPTPAASPSRSVVPTPRVGDTPESAVRAFFEAFAHARESDDPSVIEPYVNGLDSSAYQSAAGFLEGQRGLGRASVVTVQELSDFEVTAEGDQATVLFTLVEGGYDIDLDTREPLETPVVLPERRVRAIAVQVDGRWVVDRYGTVE